MLIGLFHLQCKSTSVTLCRVVWTYDTWMQQFALLCVHCFVCNLHFFQYMQYETAICSWLSDKGVLQSIFTQYQSILSSKIKFRSLSKLGVLQVLGLKRSAIRNYVLENDPVPRALLSIDPAFTFLKQNRAGAAFLQLRQWLVGPTALTPERFLADNVGEVHLLKWSAEHGHEVRIHCSIHRVGLSALQIFVVKSMESIVTMKKPTQ